MYEFDQAGLEELHHFHEVNVQYIRRVDHEVISTAILLPSADSRRVAACYKQYHVDKVLVNHLPRKKCS